MGHPEGTALKAMWYPMPPWDCQGETYNQIRPLTLVLEPGANPSCSSLMHTRPVLVCHCNRKLTMTIIHSFSPQQIFTKCLLWARRESKFWEPDALYAGMWIVKRENCQYLQCLCASFEVKRLYLKILQWLAREDPWVSKFLLCLMSLQFLSGLPSG